MQRKLRGKAQVDTRLKVVGRTLRAARVRRGLRAEDVARAVGTVQSAISQYEAGSVHPPALRLMDLAALLGVDMRRLLRRTRAIRRAA